MKSHKARVISLIFLFNTGITLNAQNNRVDPMPVPESNLFDSLGKYGLRNENNTIFVPAIYDTIVVHEDFIEVKKSGLYGVLDENGKEKLPTYYKSIQYLNEYHQDLPPIFIIQCSQGYELIDFEGVKIINGISEKIEVDWSGRAIKFNNKWGFVQPTGKVEFDFIYDSIIVWDGIAQIYLKNKTGVFYYLNDYGTTIDYDSINIFHGPCGCTIGYRDKKNHLITFERWFMFDAIAEISNQQNHCFLGVKKGKKWGVIDVVGGIKCKFRYSSLNEAVVALRKQAK